MAVIERYRKDKNIEVLASHLAGFSRGLTRQEIATTLNIQGVNDVTLWRWLSSAKDQGLIEMTGGTSNARWFASEELRKDHARAYVNRPLGKRPMVGYDELWVRDYVPNRTFYLSEKTRSRLHRRSPLGCASISQFDKHDMSLFLCGLPYGSSAMEGNSYSMLDTIDLIESGLAKKGATPVETKMILNHHDAVRYLIENISCPPQHDDLRITAREIRVMHSLLSNGLLSDPQMGGKIRNKSVAIQECAYTPLDIPEAIESCLNEVVAKAGQINDPYEQSFFLVAHISYLQPFIDCNKRTSRVICNIPLLRSGVVPMSWIGVDNQLFREALLGIYELNDPSMLSEIFVDGYMRSMESFNIMKQSREPDELSIKYHREIRQAVRSRVLTGSEDIPANVIDEDRSLFIINVERELSALRDGDDGTMIRHHLKEGDVKLWALNQEAQEPDYPVPR